MNIKRLLNDIYSSIMINKSLLILFFFTDFIFLALHSLYVRDLLGSNPYYSLEMDLGYSEFYQYMKEFWIFILLLFIFFRKKKMIYFFWSLFFLYVLLDDSLSVHENYGEFLKDYFNIQPRFGLRSEDFGEVLVSFSVGFVFFISIGISYLKTNFLGKRISVNIIVLVLALVFFGIFIDLLHVVVPYYNNRFILIEDGGEMLVMSIIACYILQMKNTEKKLSEN